MKATLISKENNEAKFTMEFTAEEFEAEIIKVYQKEKGKFEIDGFRKGKAPRSIIEKRYGEGIFWDDAINELIYANYPAALATVEADAIDQPRMDLGEVKKGEGFTITVTVECYPEFTVDNYKGIEIERVSSEVTDEDVDNEIKAMAERNARMIEVDRAAQEGDTVIIDYAGFCGDNQFEGGTAERQSLTLGSGQFIPGFEEQLVGAVKGEEREVKVTFPEEYHSEELAGQDAVFKCKVHEVKENEIPAIDDDFVKDVSEFDTLDELKASKREELEKAAVVRAENKMKNNIIEKLFESNDITVPAAMVEEELTNTLNEMDQQLQTQGMSLNDYIQFAGGDEKAIRDSFREDCFKKVKTRMLVSKVAEQEDFEVGEEEVREELENMAKQYGMDVEKLTGIIGPENVGILAGDIKVRKAVELMYETAVIK